MKNLAKMLLCTVAAIGMAACVGKRGGIAADNDAALSAAGEIAYPFTVDVSGDYPMEPVSFQQVLGETEYVALETTPDCLITEQFSGWDYPIVTDDDIFIRNISLLRFGRDGKFRNRVGTGGRGPGEYLMVTEHCVNDKTEEVFMYDIYAKSIIVYGYDGRHKRTLRMPNNTIITGMVAVTDSTLLIANNSNDPAKKHVIYPFQLISSRDGSVVKSLLPPHGESRASLAIDGNTSEVSDPAKGYRLTGVRYMAYVQPSGISVEVGVGNSMHVTDTGVALTDFVADTVYVASATGEITPRWVKAPSPMELDVTRRRYSTSGLEGERYALFVAIGNGEDMGYKVDKSTGKVTRAYIDNADIDYLQTRENRMIISPDGTGSRRFAMAYQPFRLLEWLEGGKLSGPPASPAATLREDDNPVLLIEK